MSQVGKFIIKHFLNQFIEIYTGSESDYIHYNDSDTMNWQILVGVVKDYDEESGVLVLETSTGKKFYINDWNIQLFWEPGFNFNDITQSTLYGKRLVKKRDII